MEAREFTAQQINIVLAAALRGRKLIVYGTDENAMMLHVQLKKYGLEISLFVDDNAGSGEIAGVPLRSVYDLAYIDCSKYFIVIVKPDKILQRDIFPLLHPLGLIYNEDYCDLLTKSYSKMKNGALDANLGYSKHDDLPGFKIFGDPEKSKAKTIVTLGGSTTVSGMAGIPSWPELLFDLLTGKHKYDIVLYNGAIMGYNSTLELIKLIRDVVPMKPDVVISLDGVNDLYQAPIPEFENRYRHPFVAEETERLFRWVGSKYTNFFADNPQAPVIYGLENGKSPAQYLIDNMRMMHAVAGEFGIKYLGIVQPFLLASDYDIPQWLEKFLPTRFASDRLLDVGRRRNIYANSKSYYEELVRLSADYPFICDFTHIFDRGEDIYYDFCHLYEKGNRIIAEHVYGSLKSLSYI